MNIEKFFSVENISVLADVMKEKNLEEITMEYDDAKLVLKAQMSYPAFPVSGTPSQMAPAVSNSQTVPAAAPQVSGNVVKSPIVGTFYAAASPEKPPFVTVGQQVKKGDVLMIIESMKLMNEVQSEFDGTVAEILVKNGEAVEFDQPIMIIN